MKYYFQFEGNEKLAVKLILALLMLLNIFLVILISTERPIDVYFDDKQLEVMCNGESES